MISNESKNAVALIRSHVLHHNTLAKLLKDASYSPHAPKVVRMHLNVSSATLNVTAIEKHVTTADVNHRTMPLIDFIAFLDATHSREAIDLETVTVDETHEVI